MRTDTVFISGSSGGLGISFVEEFSKNGYDVVAHARVENLKFKRQLEQISKRYNNKITPVFFDMCDISAMKNGVSNLIKAQMPINTLINNAGIAHSGFFNMTKIKTVKEVFEINFFAQLELTQLFLRYLGKHENSSIVNIASISGINLSAGECAYGVSKSAIIAFTKVLASEYKVHKVRVNAVAPGLVDAGMQSQITSRAKDRIMENSAMNRMAEADEIAKAVFFLASNNASFINGEIIEISGKLNTYAF